MNDEESRPTLRWAGMVFAIGALLAVAVAPPFVGAGASSFIHLLFAPLCHQLPDRSAHVNGDTLALCHRCTGMLAGFFLGLLATPARPRLPLRRLARLSPPRVMLLAALPATADWLLGAFGIWLNTPVSRTATGMLLGLTAGVFLALPLIMVSSAFQRSSPNLLAS